MLTHSATCIACTATLGLRAGEPQAGTVSPAATLDAFAVVGRGKAIAALPVLPALVWFECPACDTRQRR